MTEPALIELTPEMQAAIGRSEEPIPHEVTNLGIRTFARAVGYQNPVYFDEAMAREQGHRALPAPPGYFGIPVYTLERGGLQGWQSDFDNPFKRTLDGGREIERLEQVYAGDVLEAVTTLQSLEIVPSRAYGQMMIRISVTTYTRTSDGVLVGRIRSTRIHY